MTSAGGAGTFFFTSPLEGEVGAALLRREGGKPLTYGLPHTPLPDPPPQGGREQKDHQSWRRGEHKGAYE
jgi:hypothetical protein